MPPATLVQTPDDPPISRIELENVLHHAAKRYGIETAQVIWSAHAAWRHLNGLKPIPWKDVAPGCADETPRS